MVQGRCAVSLFIFNEKYMTITVTDFERITEISRHTVYSWFYRNKFPEGIKAAPSLGSSKMLIVSAKSEYFEKIKTELV